ncbi:hypothetical protein TL16_g02025 [Triparma laevis f. inornata]|uniref:Uncharacterized protein n=1 Tax=Triparma laevis f. inornata TaxID=1714386 RepID=A0A9W6ZN00_9STRA|nr:hypothetical protein TL16_g02025 [Triparma laevis f. inornata]
MSNDNLIYFGLSGCFCSSLIILSVRYFFSGSFVSADMIRRKLDKHLNHNLSEEEKLRRALRWETTKLLGFGAAEIFDVISDWMSIFRMREESRETNENGLETNIYAFLGGCSLLVACYALLQRAAIQSVINEQIHTDYISTLTGGGDIKDARKAHFARRGTMFTGGFNNRNEEMSVREQSVREKLPDEPKSEKEIKKEKEEKEEKKMELELNEKAQGMAKEYAVIERQMLLMHISLLLLFVEDMPSIILNAVVYLPKGEAIPTEAMLSIATSLLVIGYKVSMFEKLRLLQKREEDIETFFKSLSEHQLKDTKLKIMEELQKSAAAQAARLSRSGMRGTLRKGKANRELSNARDSAVRSANRFAGRRGSRSGRSNLSVGSPESSNRSSKMSFAKVMPQDAASPSTQSSGLFRGSLTKKATASMKNVLNLVRQEVSSPTDSPEASGRMSNSSIMSGSSGRFSFRSSNGRSGGSKG